MKIIAVKFSVGLNFYSILFLKKKSRMLVAATRTPIASDEGLVMEE